MTRKKFAMYLSIITMALLLIALSIRGLGEIGKFTDFSIYTIMAFLGLSISMYHFGVKTANSKNKYSFNNLIVGNMILKMLISVILILIYKSVYNIESRAFLLPFLIIYLSYTVFETYFLTKLAKT